MTHSNRNLNAEKGNDPIFLKGFEFGHLPDFLSDHTLMADAPSDRINEHARRWTQFVSGLWCDAQHLRVCYQLRYQFQKEPDGDVFKKGGRLRIRLLMRVDRESDRLDAPVGVSEFERLYKSAVEQMNSMKVRLLEMGFSLSEALYDSVHEKDSFACMTSAREIRQRELLIPIRNSANGRNEEAGSHYIVEPWMGMAGPFLVPVQLLCAQSHDVWICINLKPMSLSASQTDFMAKEATFGATYAGITQSIGVGDSGPQLQISDPQAGWLGRVFSNQLRRLSHQAFACAAYVVSTDETTCEGMAIALASSISTEVPMESSDDSEGLSRSRAEVVRFDEYAKAFEATILLRFPLNEASVTRVQRPKEFPYLRYVTDAAGAATVFRLPVNIRGGIPGIAVRQIPPDFNPGVQSYHNGKSLLIGVRSDGGEISVPLKDFAKHALITGFTGTGKTNTVLHLLDQFWRIHNIPFLVIESAKSEYRGFIKVKDMPGQKSGYQDLREDGAPVVRIYTIGNEACSPFRLNPFELQPGVRLESHIGRLQACFEAAIPQGSSGGPVPSLLADALPMIYQEKGWSLLDEGFPRDESPLLFPTMMDLKEMLLKLLDRAGPENGGRGRGYSGEVLNNLKGFILGRVGALLQGSRGLMFGTQYSVPMEELMSYPAILELNDLNEGDKGLVVMFLLVMLREYRERNKFPGGLGHITVVEEAHNVLANSIPGSTSEAQEKAVQAFCNMLAEIRSLGEGLIIADQSPQKLARDAIRNTNVQITHALRDGQDREAIADCSLMTDEQRDYLGKVRTGWAATFFMGLEKATFVKVPNFTEQDETDPEGRSGRGVGFGNVTDDEVRGHMKKLNGSDRKGPLFDLCGPCRLKCKFRTHILKGKTVFPRMLKDITDKFIGIATEKNTTELIRRHSHASAQLAMWAKLPGDSDTLWCAAVHIASPDFFGPNRRPDDYHRLLCNDPNGFAWALTKYPKKLQQSEQRGTDAT